MRTSLKLIGIAIPVVALGFVSAALAFPPPTVVGGGADKPAAGDTPKTEAKTILDMLKADSNLSTFVELVTTAGLADDLKHGDHTVFAPSNDALKASGKVDEWKKDKAALKALLNHHIVKGKKFAAADLKDGSSIKPVAGADLKVKSTGGNTMIDDAKVTKTDGSASNGVIHTVDKVLISAAAPKTEEPAKKPPVGT